MNKKFNNIIEIISIYETIMLSQKQYEEGKITDAYEYLDELKLKYDL